MVKEQTKIIFSTDDIRSKVDEVREGIYRLAREKGAGAQLPPVRELCTLFHTTNTTLKDALDLLEEEKLLYRQERKGIFVSSKILSKNLLVVMNTSLFTDVTASPFWSMLWRYLTQQTIQREALDNTNCVFHFEEGGAIEGNPLPEKIVKMVKSRHIDGCIIVGFSSQGDDWKVELGVPHVIFAGYGPCAVFVDGEAIAFQAVQMLARQGCKRIGMWSPGGLPDTNYYSQIEHRGEYKGFRNALDVVGQPYYAELLRQAPPAPSVRNERKVVTFQEQGYRLAKEIFTTLGEPQADGLFISNDMMTDGVLVALDELGIKVGQDLKLATHGNAGSPILFGRTDNIIVLDFDPFDVAQTLFSLLDMLIVGQMPSTATVQLQPKLREKRS